MNTMTISTDRILLMCHNMIITDFTKVNRQEEKGMIRVPMHIMMGLRTKGHGKMISSIPILEHTEKLSNY